jgi:hypothetical protein
MRARLKHFGILVAAALGVASSGAGAQLAPASKPPAIAARDTGFEDRKAEGLKLVKLMQPPEMVLAQIDSAMGTLAQQFEQVEALKGVEADYPGITRYLIESLRPATLAEVERNRPAYFEELANFYAAHFTLSEIKQLVSFWGAPLGQRFIRQVNKNMKFTQSAKDMVTQIGSGNDNISETAMKQDMRAAAIKAVAQTERADLDAVAKFAATPVGQKLLRLSKEKQAIEMKWANVPLSKEADAQIRKDVLTAMNEFMARVDADRANKASGKGTDKATTAKKTN